MIKKWVQKARNVDTGTKEGHEPYCVQALKTGFPECHGVSCTVRACNNQSYCF